jgi:hypothetical protein
VTGQREREVIKAFVALSTSLAEGFDVVDLLDELTTDCTRLLDVASAGLLLADARGVLHLMAASSEATRDIELYQVQRAEGPCLDCYRTGAPVNVGDLADEAARWPQFAAAALAHGFVSVHAVPMRLNDMVLGALNLFGNHIGSLDNDDLVLAQSLADVASVALIQDKAGTDKDLVVSQLTTALTSRVLLEQAKGVLAQAAGSDMEQAYRTLRQYTRDHNQKLAEVAAAVVARELTPQQLLEHAQRRPSATVQPPARDEH